MAEVEQDPWAALDLASLLPVDLGNGYTFSVRWSGKPLLLRIFPPGSVMEVEEFHTLHVQSSYPYHYLQPILFSADYRPGSASPSIQRTIDTAAAFAPDINSASALRLFTTFHFPDSLKTWPTTFSEEPPAARLWWLYRVAVSLCQLQTRGLLHLQLSPECISIDRELGSAVGEIGGTVWCGTDADMGSTTCVSPAGKIAWDSPTVDLSKPATSHDSMRDARHPFPEVLPSLYLKVLPKADPRYWIPNYTAPEVLEALAAAKSTRRTAVVDASKAHGK